MKSIISQKECKLIEKRSRFISCVFSCNSKDEQAIILKELKRKHPSATHVCYASIIDGEAYSSDDREPSGTAGVPISSMLKKYGVDNCLCAVVRYFGGVKLGVPGLIDAYKKSAELCFEDNTKDVVLKNEYMCKCSFASFSAVKSLLAKNNISTTNEDYSSLVTFCVYLSETERDMLSNKDVEITPTGNKKYV